ncbi:DUF6009 family protein [Streptomyces sp. NPDC029704]|uniref:Uncharacterized protein n=1 Tax=Streptomyces luteosporeus TaxID=173856 RepID=A0ABN3TX54_9ACTN
MCSFSNPPNKPIIGYAELEESAEPTEPSRRYRRRVFCVTDNDRSEPGGQYQDATPHQAVNRPRGGCTAVSPTAPGDAVPPRQRKRPLLLARSRSRRPTACCL